MSTSVQNSGESVNLQVESASPIQTRKKSESGYLSGDERFDLNVQSNSTENTCQDVDLLQIANSLDNMSFTTEMDLKHSSSHEDIFVPENQQEDVAFCVKDLQYQGNNDDKGINKGIEMDVGSDLFDQENSVQLATIDNENLVSLETDANIDPSGKSSVGNSDKTTGSTETTKATNLDCECEGITRHEDHDETVSVSEPLEESHVGHDTDSRSMIDSTTMLAVDSRGACGISPHTVLESKEREGGKESITCRTLSGENTTQMTIRSKNEFGKPLYHLSAQNINLTLSGCEYVQVGNNTKMVIQTESPEKIKFEEKVTGDSHWVIKTSHRKPPEGHLITNGRSRSQILDYKTDPQVELTIFQDSACEEVFKHDFNPFDGKQVPEYVVSLSVTRKVLNSKADSCDQNAAENFYIMEQMKPRHIGTCFFLFRFFGPRATFHVTFFLLKKQLKAGKYSYMGTYETSWEELSRTTIIMENKGEGKKPSKLRSGHRPSSSPVRLQPDGTQCASPVSEDLATDGMIPPSTWSSLDATSMDAPMCGNTDWDLGQRIWCPQEKRRERKKSSRHESAHRKKKDSSEDDNPAKTSPVRDGLSEEGITCGLQNTSDLFADSAWRPLSHENAAVDAVVMKSVKEDGRFNCIDAASNERKINSPNARPKHDDSAVKKGKSRLYNKDSRDDTGSEEEAASQEKYDDRQTRNSEETTLKKRTGQCKTRKCEVVREKLAGLQDNGQWEDFDKVAADLLQCFNWGKKDMCCVIVIEQGIAAFQQSDLENARRLFLKAVELTDETDNPELLRGRAYFLLANVYRENKSLGMAEKSLQLSEQNLSMVESDEDKAELCYNYGNFLMEVLNISAKPSRNIVLKAKGYFEKELQIVSKCPDKRVKVKKMQYALLKIAVLLLDCRNQSGRNRNVVEDDVLEAKSCLDRIENELWDSIAFGTKIQFFLARSDQFYRLGKYTRALELAEQALSMIKERGFNTQINKAQERIIHLNQFIRKDFIIEIPNEEFVQQLLQMTDESHGHSASMDTDDPEEEIEALDVHDRDYDL